MDNIRAVLDDVAPPGTLRLVNQRVRIHTRGQDDGIIEIADAVADVQGNLVPLVLLERIDDDADRRTRLETAWAQLRADLAADGLAACDSVEVILDADGSSQIQLVLALDVERDELLGPNAHYALHHGAWHARHSSPDIEDLRDRLAEPQPRLLGRLWRRLRGR